MKTKDFSKKVLVALTMMLALAMNAKAQKSTQEQRMMAFQTVMAMHDITYKNLIKDGKYKEAIAPLTTLINILDTTTISQDTEISSEMIKVAKADYLYDQACCYAMTKQKKQALAALAKSVDSGYKRYDNMRHDGGNRAFAEMDAIDLYNYCKTTGKGINCRQLAISLCEMYLSMGIPARYVTCMPADPLDYECHVINTVWSEQLQKWLWIDPTFDAWVMDESDYRPNPAEEDICLIPVGFVNDNWKCDTTTDPDFFWAKPE